MATLVTDAEARKLVVSDRRLLAPKMEDCIRDMESLVQAKGQRIRVYETARSHTLARMYFALGASKSPDGWRTWHFYMLAADIIHPDLQWAPWDAQDQASIDWRNIVVESGKAAGLDWGGDWVSFKDRPHFQFGAVK